MATATPPPILPVDTPTALRIERVIGLANAQEIAALQLALMGTLTADAKALVPALDISNADQPVVEPELVLWTPIPGPQTLAYESTADVLGFGGSAGGGKSSVLLGLAVNKHRRSLILRKQATQGRGLIDYAREVLTDLGSFNSVSGVWRDLPGGRQIQFAGVANPGDEQKHKGRAKDLLGIDEADMLAESVVRFLMGWVRTTTLGQRCRVVMCFNPPATAEGRWLLDYFGPWIDPKHPNPALPGELRWYATLPDQKEVQRPDGQPFANAGETIRPKSRTFIPARVTDNPYLMATDYVATLQALPEPLRSQLLYGDMTAGLEDDPWQAIPTSWVQAAMNRWTPEGRGTTPLTALGVDVARGGRDQTVIAPRYGAWFGHLKKYLGIHTPDGPTVAALVVEALGSMAAGFGIADAEINIDVVGYGSSAYDCLKGQPGLNVNPINNGAKCAATDRSGKLSFLNIRAASYWSLREALDPSGPEKLALPPDRELLADLCAPRYKLLASGIQLEAKEDLIKRLGRSPDAGDAVVMAHFRLPELVLKYWM